MATKIAKTTKPTTTIVIPEGLANATPAFRDAVERGKALINDMSQLALDGYRELGHICSEMSDNPQDYGGAGAVFRFAKHFEWSASQAYKMRAFYNNYNLKEYKALCALRTPDGRQLTWSHVIQLLSVQNTKDREKLQIEAASNGWTSAQLEKQVVKRHGGSRRPGSGRRFAEPKDPLEGCTITTELVSATCKRLEQLLPGQLQRIGESDPQSYDAPLYAALSGAIREMEQAAVAMTEQVDAATKVKRHMAKVLEQRGVEF